MKKQRILPKQKFESFQANNGLLLINAVECDPGLVHDAWIYKNRMEEVLAGVKLITYALGIQEVILATKEPLNQSLHIKQYKVADRFPMGYEKNLIKAVTGKEIPKGKHPSRRKISKNTSIIPLCRTRNLSSVPRAKNAFATFY